MDSKDDITGKELNASNPGLERAKSSLNVSRAVSNSSKKSIQERKEDFSKRVQKLKNQLNSTKNHHKNKMSFKSTAFVQPKGYFNNTVYRNIETYQPDDGSLSPTDFQIGFTSS